MPELQKSRAEMPQSITWDTTALFPSDEACRDALASLTKSVNTFYTKYADKLSSLSAADLVTALENFSQIQAEFNRVGQYPSLRTAVDRTDTAASKLEDEIQIQLATLSASLTFFVSELSLLDTDTLKQAQEKAPQYQIFLKDMVDYKDHLLSKDTEAALAALGQNLSFSEKAYDTIKGADLQFDSFQVEGKSYPLSYILYENCYAGETDTQVRREAFKSFSQGLKKYRHTLAAVYNNQVQTEKTMATLRGFSSVFDYLLFHQKVPRKLYDRQLDITMEKLGPVMRRWASLLQKVHGWDAVHYADLKVKLDPTFSPEISLDKAQEMIRQAMEPMGEDYQSLVLRAFPERWVDFAQNAGKEAVGFCTVPPQSHPFILLNWDGSLSEVFTLAHELGHGAQGLLTEKNNAYLQADFSWYDVESPSTFHEMLLARSLVKNASDPRSQRFALASLVENTYYHNFVTHFLEGYYQREVYKCVDRGESLSADDLDRIFRETLEKFWGDAVILDEGAEYTWMRQPHYYNGLYSYTYSASLVISTEMDRRLTNQEKGAVHDWIRFLSTGGPTPPIEHAALAGIQLEDGSALERTIQHISDLVDQVAALSK